MRRRSLHREIADGLGVVMRDPLLRVNTTFGCLANFVLTGYQSVLVVYLIRVVGLSAGSAGVILALTGLGGVLGALVARRVARFGTSVLSSFVLLLGPLRKLRDLPTRS